jgi:hypothetical protein
VKFKTIAIFCNGRKFSTFEEQEEVKEGGKHGLHLFQRGVLAQEWWCTPIIPETQEAEVGESHSEASSGQKCETLSET